MKFIKPVAEVITSPIVNKVNSSIDKEIFPDSWKVAGVYPVLKIDNPINEKDFWPISILLVLSKMYDVILKQLSYYHSSDTPLPPHLFKGGSKFWLPPPEGGDPKNFKKGWKYGVGEGLLKRGGWHFFYIIFSKFIIFTFTNYFTLCKVMLCIWRKIIFFCHHNFMKKGHSKLSKNEPENIT